MISLRVEPAELDAAEVAVEGDAYRHLFRARRLAVGDRVRLADGAGRARWSEVAAVGGKGATLVPGGAAPAPEPAARVTLLVAAPKKDRASWLVEKATELGVAAVRLLDTERTPREFGAGTVRRLERVATAAFEQCGRGRLPEISGTHGWDEMPGLLEEAGAVATGGADGVEGPGGVGVGAASGAGQDSGAASGYGRLGRWVLDLDPEAATGAELAAAAAAVPRHALVVGPEGGWSEAERRDLAAWGCRAVVLGPTVLRVETAALAGAALLLAGGGATSDPSGGAGIR